MSLFALDVEANMNSYTIVEQRISSLIEALIPNGGAATIGETRLKTALDQVGQVAYRQGSMDILSNLLTVEDLSEMFQVSPRRIRARAQLLHDRFGVGWKVPGTRGTWLFIPSEIEIMRPGSPGRPVR